MFIIHGAVFKMNPRNGVVYNRRLKGGVIHTANFYVNSVNLFLCLIVLQSCRIRSKIMDWSLTRWCCVLCLVLFTGKCNFRHRARIISIILKFLKIKKHFYGFFFFFITITTMSM